MMVAMHQADGFVSGTNQNVGSVLRPLFQIIKVAPQTTTASSCQILEVEDSSYGEKGVLFMADCGVIPEPTVEQLADIAVSTAQLARHLLGVRPRVALLSFSTKGSSNHPSLGRIQAATALAEKKGLEKQIDADFDGELQVDTALVPEIAVRKSPSGKIVGNANVLIFPDLNSGNIASKLVRHIARANAYGQILLGLDRPAAEAGHRHIAQPFARRLLQRVGRKPHEATLVGAQRLERLADHRRLRAAAADPAVHRPIGRDDRLVARLARSRPLGAHHDRGGERHPLADQLVGLGEEFIVHDIPLVRVKG